MSRIPRDLASDRDPMPAAAGESDNALENTADVEDMERLEIEQRESEERHAPDLPDRAFERITPQV